MVATKEAKRIIEQDVKEFAEILKERDSLIFPFIRFHLLTENILERIAICELKRADRILDKGNLTYHQKLCLVDSFDVVEDIALQALKNLNTIRNKFAHTKTQNISLDDIDRIGRPYGKTYSKLRGSLGNNLEKLIERTFILIFKDLVACVYKLEHGVIDNSSSDKS